MSGNERPNVYNIKKFSTTFMLVTIIIVAYANPSILDFIENLGGPIIAAILFVMPIVAVYSVKKLHKHKNLVLDGFVLLTGLLTISSVVYKMMI